VHKHYTQGGVHYITSTQKGGATKNMQGVSTKSWDEPFEKASRILTECQGGRSEMIRVREVIRV